MKEESVRLILFCYRIFVLSYVHVIFKRKYRWNPMKSGSFTLCFAADIGVNYDFFLLKLWFVLLYVSVAEN